MAPKRSDPSHLKPGTEVEVSPVDEGFKGSWFVAKVIKRSTKTKYLVEYTTMFEDEAGTIPVKETLNAAQIRPLQPHDVGQKVFQLGDLVDAYYNDGWWEGKVSEVLAGEEKVVVDFSESGEKIVFGLENLRGHRVWVDGVWIPGVEDGVVSEDKVKSRKKGKKGKKARIDVSCCLYTFSLKLKVNSGEDNSAQADEKVDIGAETSGKAEEKQEKVDIGTENSGKTEEKQAKVDIGTENSGRAEEKQEKLVVPLTRKRAAVDPRQPDSSYLKPGSDVEISSDDSGFRGSWFIGTIIRCLSKKKPAKFLVEYKTLFDDEEGKKPLKETLHEYQLRPVQPPEKQPREFKFGDEVDAYFNDGWWEGDITEELGGERFNVYFRPAKEQLEFGKESLRIHREWENGAWKPPIEVEDEVTKEEEENEKEAKSVADTFVETFGKGALVEVSSDEDGFQGAWFCATVIEVLENTRYVVEYTTLRTEDDTAFLREEVDSQHIRPYPPSNMVKTRFKMYQEVDACHNDGWWIGVISKVLKGGSRYKVYFRDTKEELEFEHSDLRLHQDWIDGKWFVTLKDLKLS